MAVDREFVYTVWRFRPLAEVVLAIGPWHFEPGHGPGHADTAYSIKSEQKRTQRQRSPKGGKPPNTTYSIKSEQKRTQRQRSPKGGKPQKLRIVANRSKSEHTASALPWAENHQILRITSNQSKSEHSASALPRGENPPNTAYRSKSEQKRTQR